MKFKFTSLKLLVMALLFSQAVLAQAIGDYQTFNNGNWSSTATWARWDGSTWVNPAPSAPVSTDGVITITHTVTLTAPVTADQIVVESGGNLNVDVNSGGDPSANNLTLNNGTGTDLLVSSGGTLLLRGYNSVLGNGTILVTGTMNWLSGYLNSITTISSGGILNIDGSLNVAKFLYKDLTNNGTINWTSGISSGGLVLQDAGFVNNGIINENFSSDRGFGNLGSTSYFTNNGTFNKTTTYNFNSNGVPFTNSSTGILKGLGSFTVFPITNSGTIAPGASPGLLTVNPSMISNTSNIKIEIVTGTPGTGYDQLAVTGSLDLTGKTINIIDDANSPIQDYVIMTTTGTFSTSLGQPTVNKPTNFTTVGIVGTNTFVVRKDQQFPLPVVWGNFTALAKNKQVQLNWTTLQELNTSHFIVEHSTDGRQFSPIATISASGNSSDVMNYSYTHTSPTLSKNNFYRIQQVDIDNKKNNSAIRNVRFSGDKVVAVLATPNPVRDMLQLSVQANDITIRLTDFSGKTIRNMNLLPGTQQMNMQDLPTGIYQLVIYQNKQQIDVQRIVKQ